MDADAGIAALELLPIGTLPRPLAEHLARRLSRSLRLPCRLLAPDPRFGLPLLPGREQADADALLRMLEARPRTPDTVLVGLTSADIGHPIFTFFFGRARHGGGAAIVSLARLSPVFYGLADDPDLTETRAVHEVLHELGHVAGLRHCDRADCLMHFAGNVEAIDVRGARFCPDCLAGLPAGLLVGGA